VVSTGSLQDYFNWSVGELGWVYPDGFPDYYTTLESYSGGVFVPEPTHTGFLFGAGVLAVSAAAGFASMSKSPVLHSVPCAERRIVAVFMDSIHLK
jgi:hypothetical protein